MFDSLQTRSHLMTLNTGTNIFAPKKHWGWLVGSDEFLFGLGGVSASCQVRTVSSFWVGALVTPKTLMKTHLKVDKMMRIFLKTFFSPKLGKQIKGVDSF